MTRRPTRELDFTTMSFAAGGHIRTALLDEHRVLTCMAGWSNIFVIAHHDDTDRARQVTAAQRAEQEGMRSVYLIVVTDEQMTAIADHGVVLNVAVQLADADYATADTAIRLYNAGQITVTTEHGDYLTELTTSREIRTGDYYTGGNERPGSGSTAQILYRARTDYDPTTGEVQHHIVTADNATPAPGTRTGALTDGPDEIVFRVIDPVTVITRLTANHFAPV